MGKKHAIDLVGLRIPTRRMGSSGHSRPKLRYRCLLLSTGLNMQSARVRHGLDGTKLLEELASTILHHYSGIRSITCIFGTAQSDSGFADKIRDLCSQPGEGTGFETRENSHARIAAQDDKLDTVGWKPFSENLPGKLIVFGEHKTGTN